MMSVLSANVLGVLVALTGVVAVTPRAEADVFIRYLPSDIGIRSGPSQPATRSGPEAVDASSVRGNLDVLVAHGRVLLSGTGRAGQEYSVWFNSGDATFYILEPSHRGVFEVSRAAFEEVEAGRRRLRQDLDARLAISPEKDHEKIRRISDSLEERLFGARPLLAEYRATEAKRESGGHSCTRTEVFVERKKNRVLCSTSHTDLNIADGDWSVLEAMHRIGREIAASTAVGARLIPRFVLDLIHGVPVKIEYMGPGSGGRDLVLQQVSNEEIASDRMLGYQSYRVLPVPAYRPGI